ncbi:hypothetical protein GGI07_000021 [Coemansia sp. Benny D115]|nr:hypothetical protein GGI07_000021 [Coemansia sp. Benny D115]
MITTPMMRRSMSAALSTVLRQRPVMSRACLSYSARVSSSHHDHQPHDTQHMAPHELLDSMHPKKNHKELLNSILDGELDYDTDMGAASVNNVEAERRAEAAKKAAKIARERTSDEFAQRHF